jgi:hypothetical protein
LKINLISSPGSILILAFLLLTLTACENGGSITGLQESCKLTDTYGRCETNFRDLTGRYTKRIETNATFPGYEAESEITVSVEAGAVKVSLVGPDDTLVSGVARPGKPVTLTGISVITTDANRYYIPVIFEALQEGTRGIEYVIEYRVP